MPEITLYRKPTSIPDAMVRELTPALRAVVARELSDPTDRQPLTPEQVEVRVTDGHPLDDNTGDLEIKVSAKDFKAHDVWVDRVLESLTRVIQGVVPSEVSDPSRPIDTWLELDLGTKFGCKIWP